MERWLNQNLSELLEFPVPDDLIEYLLRIQNDRDLDEYLKTLLNFDNRKHTAFVNEFKRRKAAENQLCGYKKIHTNNDGPKLTEKKKSKTKEKEKEKENVSVNQDKQDKNSKKKSKFTSFYSYDEQNKHKTIPNRHKCDCEAKTHNLINNCLNCGRIVCAQEGAGPCFFCGELVCTPDQQSVLAMNTKQSDSLYNRLMEQVPNKGQDAAISLRNQLLEYDKNSTKRTEVIDDECDYYQSVDSVWISKQERESLEKHEEAIQRRKHASRLDMKFNIDINKRTVEEAAGEYDEEYLLDHQFEKQPQVEYEHITCPTVESISLSYIENLSSFHPEKYDGPVSIVRVQDKELQEMVDEGFCLSMHQPYASLLVAGIKTHEGRTWSTSHRGRLWIHAAAKIPSTEEISAVEAQYQCTQFPKDYPTACLLGCVTVVDVLPQEEYRLKYPHGESDSPYVFICEDFKELYLKFPMQGKHKIYKLDKAIHRAALKCLERSK